MKKPCVILRADGGPFLGMGHLVRAGALAVGLANNGIEPLLVIKDAEPEVLNFLKYSGTPFINLTAAQSRDRETEANFIAGLMTQMAPLAVFLDLANGETRKDLSGFRRYVEILKAAGKPVVALDGPSGPSFLYDTLIVPYFGAEKNIKKDPGVRLLLGPDYFIFRDEFRGVVGQERAIRENANRVLISMGGSDPGSLTLVAVKAIAQVSSAKHVKIVLGGAFSETQTEAVRQIAEQNNFEILKAPSDMAALMLWCDIALVSGGLTKYELAATGTPGISLTQHKEEDHLTALFATQGSITHLGLGASVPVEAVTFSAAMLIKNFKERQAMSRVGKKLVDGRGLERVLQETVLAKAAEKRQS